MLKTLVAGEASGTGLAESLRLPYSVLDALIQHARVEKLVEVRGASGAGSAGYRYVADRPRPRPRRCSSSTSAATSGRRRCRSRSTTPTCAPAWRRGPTSIATRSRRASSSSIVNNGDVRSARAGGELRQVAVPLRRARQRQDRRRRRDRPGARHRDVRAARHRRRRPDHHDVRPGQPPAASADRRVARASSPTRRTIAAGSGSGGRWSWSAAS